ncbi:MAG: hypothetical protein HY013_15785, partial [Candidatus Solibacter usitatus]|nr:hypothetical protein [Candidatus Solibacter usitatus]
MWGNDRFDNSGGKVRRSWDEIEVQIPRCPRCRGIHEVVYKVRLAGVLGLTALLLGGLVVLFAFQKGLLSGLVLLAFFWYFFYYKAVAWIFGYIFAPVFWLPCRLVVPWKVRFSSHGKKHPLVKAR